MQYKNKKQDDQLFFYKKEYNNIIFFYENQLYDLFVTWVRCLYFSLMFRFFSKYI